MVVVIGIIVSIWHYRRKHRSEIEQARQENRDEPHQDAPLSLQSGGTEFSDEGEIEMFSVETTQPVETSRTEGQAETET